MQNIQKARLCKSYKSKIIKYNYVTNTNCYIIFQEECTTITNIFTKRDSLLSHKLPARQTQETQRYHSTTSANGGTNEKYKTSAA